MINLKPLQLGLSLFFGLDRLSKVYLFTLMYFREINPCSKKVVMKSEEQSVRMYVVTVLLFTALCFSCLLNCASVSCCFACFVLSCLVRCLNLIVVLFVSLNICYSMLHAKMYNIRPRHHSMNHGYLLQ